MYCSVYIYIYVFVCIYIIHIYIYIYTYREGERERERCIVYAPPRCADVAAQPVLHVQNTFLSYDAVSPSVLYY